MTKRLHGKTAPQELTEDILNLPRFLRGQAFLYTVEKLFDGSRHIDHWKQDCINVLVDEWQIAALEAGRPQYFYETMAYLHAYQRIVGGFVPKQQIYGKKHY